MVKRLEQLWSLLNGKWVIVLTILFMGGVYAIKSSNYFGWRNDETKLGEPIMSDGAGYYAHLPQWFIYGTSHYEFLDTIKERYGSSRFADNIYETRPGKPHSNKYYTGTAIALVPFFAAAHTYAHNSAYPEDGYSLPYQFMANAASIFYFLLGCIAVSLLLVRFRIHRFWIAGVLMAIGFGTNISFYSNVQVPFSHPFSFAAVAWLMLYAKKWTEEHTAKNFILLCLLIGWAAIIRPTNVLVLAFVPFLFAGTADFVFRMRMLFTEKRKHFAIGLLVLLAFVFFQLWNTHDQTGKWALNTYTNESFDNWNSPKILEVLFSWRKGLFVFAPILLLIFPGWIVLYRRERRLFWGSVVFFALFTYVTASWWCWWYGGGLGMRNYIDVLPILAIAIAFLLQYSRIWLKGVIVGFMVLTAWLYQVYEFQMKYNILHYDEMNYEQFSHVFLKQGLRYRWCLLFRYEELPERSPERTRHPQFLIHGNEFDPNRERRLRGDDASDNPIATIYSDPALNGKLFGARVTGSIRLNFEQTNPQYIVRYYDRDSLIRQDYFIVGHFIDEIKQLKPVTIDIFPNLRYGQFDSVQVELDDNSSPISIRNLRIEERIYGKE